MVDSEHSDLEARLLRAGREVHMSDELRAQTLSALGLGAVGAGVAHAAASAGASSITKSGVAGWLTSKVGMLSLVGVSIVGAVGAVGSTRLGAAQDEKVARAVVPPVAPMAAPRAVEPAAAHEKTPEATLGPEVSSPPERKVAERLSPAPAAVPLLSGPSTLSQELKALGEVESLLKAGQARGALSALDHYRRTFPRQQLGLEAEVLTIQALAGSGATAAAQERAAHFLERHPNSPLSARVRRYAE